MSGIRLVRRPFQMGWKIMGPDWWYRVKNGRRHRRCAEGRHPRGRVHVMSEGFPHAGWKWCESCMRWLDEGQPK